MKNRIINSKNSEMMDSQEKALAQGNVEETNINEADSQVDNTEGQVQEEVQTTETATDKTEEKPAEETPVGKVYTTKQEVLERVKEIAHSEETPQKDEVDHLKNLFYKMHIAERDAAQKEYLDNGGNPDSYVTLPDNDEEQFKAEMTLIKEKRAKHFQEQEAEKQDNLKRKLDIIERIKAMATSPDEANKTYPEFKELQQKWKEIKAVPQDKANEIWRTYQLHVEQFYDLLKLNNQAREYDFKKNLELKEKLCEAAERLTEEPDVVSAFHQLQELHQRYREIGPVSKDLREEVWVRFKAASTIINKKHQQHFEQLRGQEEGNLTKKTALCEKAEEMAKEENKNTADWERHTKAMIDLQKEWKTIGFTPQKMNVKIFERFRKACDDFFGRKADYYKGMKEIFSENAKKKRALVEQAKALMDSTDWRSTGDKLINLQREWKTIGMIPRKMGDRLWNEFINACNHFFDARNEANGGEHGDEHANLEKKLDIISRLKNLDAEGEEANREQVQNLVEEYSQIGHVPYKEKDKTYDEFREITSKLYKKLGVSPSHKRLDNFKGNMRHAARNGESALDNERGRLMRHYEQLKQEIITYENNLGFFNTNSKKGNSLVDEINRKVQKLKDEVELVRQKIKDIDQGNDTD